MKAPLRVETARLILAPPEPPDAAAVFERYASDADVTRFLGWPRHRSLADTQAFVNFSAAEWTRWPAGPYLIWSRDDPELLGGTGFTFEAHDRAITGYVLAKDAWGRGYATEALTAIVDVARAIGLTRLTAFCHPEHRASARVLEKCGFQLGPGRARHEFPNLTPGVLIDVLCYEIALSQGTTRFDREPSN